MAVKKILLQTLVTDPAYETLLRSYEQECVSDAWGNRTPDIPAFQHMEDAGLFSVFGVYECERLVGFSTLLCAGEPSSGARICAINHVYVCPESRAQRGAELLVATIAEAERHEGLITLSAQVGSALDINLRKHPKLFTPIETVYKIRRK